MTLDSIDMTDAAWYSKLNSNFEKLFDLPFPIATYADVSALTTAKNPKLYKDCFALIGSLIHTSDGTTWEPYRETLTFIADLNPATATLGDIQTAYNNLLADLRLKKWILP